MLCYGVFAQWWVMPFFSVSLCGAVRVGAVLKCVVVVFVAALLLRGV